MGFSILSVHDESDPAKFFVEVVAQVLDTDVVVEEIGPATSSTNGFPEFGSSAPKTTFVGYVPLGSVPHGKNLIPWNFEVNGQKLGPGDYLLDAIALKNGTPTGAIPPVPVRVLVQADGSVSAAPNPIDFACGVTASGAPRSCSSTASGVPWWTLLVPGLGAVLISLAAVAAWRRRGTRTAP